MSCSDIDIKGYFLGELSAQEHQAADRHLEACAGCRDELDRLHATGVALMSLRDEEVPRRIAFVSDKIFEPGWWQRLWRSGPGLGFAAAGILSLAIVVHGGLTRPAPPAGLDAAAVEQIVDREVARRLDAAVANAVAAAEERHREKAAELLAAAGKRFELERQADMLAVQEQFEYLRKRLNVNMQLASAFRSPERGGQ